MTPENGNFDQIKKAWLAMGESLGTQPTPDNNPEDLNRKKTALDSLCDKYRRFWSISLLMTFSSFLIFSHKLAVETHLNFLVGALFAAFFLITFCMDFWLWNGIRSIDPLRMGVAEVAEKSMFYRKRHLQFMAFLIPLALALLCFTGYVYSLEIYFLIGMIIGAALGVIIGVNQFREFMKEYRKLRDHQ